ncbi:hypothetical protein DCAR_0521955 [Daucus carota subsp. sativus]|uniref:PDZ domain-containing protein n=1 Tax=Daucus carota subsp. sativus TaxID=79200 RepID=A0A162A624_DAUCS|nr:PREDICTED: putative protease Do-like 14 [Daucus carota subsp. sativus]WOH02566.1 hypothetical protein DCAR_0521955 [Daucus carota subsp. sativus]
MTEETGSGGSDVSPGWSVMGHPHVGISYTTVRKRPSYRPDVELCLRFPQTQFDPTVFKEIQDFYSFKPSASHILNEISSCPDLDISTASVNNEDLGVVYSEIAPSVVSVCAFDGVERKWHCSGLVIHWSLTDNEATILTSAKVLFKPKDPEFKFHLIIRMGDGTVLFGKEDQVDFYHNLLTLKVKSKVELEVLDLRSRQAQIVHGMEVISLGRSFYSSCLYDSFGNLYEEHPNFGCDELLKSSCGIREICEGGPLVTRDGYVVGINFFGDHPCAHPLPTPIILSCLEMWKSFRMIVRPWFGIRLIDMNQLSKEVSNHVRKFFNISTLKSHVFVKEVFMGSVARKSNVRRYDSVATVNGIRIESYKQYSQLLSEASRAATSCDSSQRLVAVINPFDCRTEDISIEAEYVSVDDGRLYDCWPAAKVEEWKIYKSGPTNPTSYYIA